MFNSTAKFFVLATFMLGSTLASLFFAPALASAADCSASTTDSIKAFMDSMNGTNSGDGCASVPTSAPYLKVKSEGELIRYVTCYQLETSEKKYYFEYERYIKAAAREFGIPLTLFTCLLFRESRFNKNARSRSGALGLGQFTGSGASFVANVLTSGRLAERKKKTCLDKEKAKSEKSLEDRKNCDLADIKQGNLELTASWNSYFSAISDSSGKGKMVAPLTFSKNLARQPIPAIGAAALYLRYIIDQLQEQVEKTSSPNQPAIPPEKNLSLLLTAVGAYNFGHNGALSLAEKTASNDATEWVKSLKNAKLETSKHIESIANCAAGTAGGPTQAYQPMHGDKEKDCFSPNAEAESASIKKVKYAADKTKNPTTRQPTSRPSGALKNVTETPKKPSKTAGKDIKAAPGGKK